MSLIEGVGDEVVQFLGLGVALALAAVAWMSTNARPDRYRALLLMRSTPSHPVTVSIRTGGPNLLYTNASANGSTDTVAVSSSPSPERAEAGVIPLQEMDSIVDAEMALFDNNRLHFYRRVEPGPNARADESEAGGSSEAEARDEAEPPRSAQAREMDSIVSAMEADVSAPPAPPAAPAAEVTEPAPSIEHIDKCEPPAEGEGEGAPRERKKILIRLKYLNDTLKEVEGSLDEPLKDFKWRHFRRELSAGRVRLIHRGRVLADDAASLRALGLTHRDVVHALVHPARHALHPHHPPPHEQPFPLGAPQPAPAGGAAPAAGAAERGWDLENILMTLVSVALTVVWFFRCEYSNMFTASASVALFGLTVFYSVAIFGLYLSDTFQFDRRQTQPVPNTQ